MPSLGVFDTHPARTQWANQQGHRPADPPDAVKRGMTNNEMWSRMTHDADRPPPGSRRRGARLLRAVLGAVGGLVAGGAALAVAELVSAAVRPEAGPVTAVGGAAIDLTPMVLKDYAVRHFGIHDKLVLQLGIPAVLAVLALALGLIALRFRRTGAAGVLVFGVVGAVAAVSRPGSGPLDALPSAAGAVAGAAVPYLLAARLAWATPAAAPSGAPTAPPAKVPRDTFDRHGFIRAAAAAAVASAAV